MRGMMKNKLKLASNILKSFVYSLIYFFKNGLRNRAGAGSYAYFQADRRYPDYLKHGAALEAVKPLALKYCRGAGIDVGASRWPLDGARGIDNGDTENAYAINEADASLDFVFSSHTLEHLKDPEAALDEWIGKLKKGGVLFLYLPHPSCEMWKPELLPFHEWSPDPVFMESLLMGRYGMEILYITYLPDAYFSFAVVARKR